ncbi:MAG: hypothetical protein OHK0039_00420 [Bacteroidia bacterium]
MKKTALLMACLLACGLHLSAQRIVTVAPGVGTLNDAIDGDTTAAGARTDLNTIYELESGGVYKLTRSIENLGKGSDTSPYPLHIRAAAGATVKPFLQPTVPSGGSSARTFMISANLTVEGLHITNQDDLGALLDRVFQVNADDVRLIVRDCFVEKCVQTCVRNNGANPKMYFYNTTVNAMGRPQSMDNGRFIDPRDSDIDTVWVENCVIYNVASRFFRNGGGVYEYINIDQSTFVNSGQRAFNFGDVKELHFTNNIIMNGAFLGREADGGRAIFELEELAAPDTPIVRIAHNNYFISADMQTEYDNDPLRVGPLFMDSLTNRFNPPALTSTNFVEVIDFNNGLASIVPIFTEFVLNGYNGSSINADWDNSGAPHSFVYTVANGPMSVVGGTTGQPVGAGMATTAIERTTWLDAGLRIFPNPAHDLLYVENLRGQRWNQVQVVDMQGRALHTQVVGMGVTSIELSRLPAGVYLLVAMDEAASRRTTTRFIKY